MAGEHDVNANCGNLDFVCAGAEGFINSLFHGVTDSLGGLAKSLGSFWVNTPSIPLTGKDNAVYLKDAACGVRQPQACMPNPATWIPVRAPICGTMRLPTGDYMVLTRYYALNP